jgi:hypothetical protein
LGNRRLCERFSTRLRDRFVIFNCRWAAFRERRRVKVVAVG